MTLCFHLTFDLLVFGCYSRTQTHKYKTILPFRSLSFEKLLLSHPTGVLRLPRSLQEEECVSVRLQYEGNPVAVWISH